jgi:dimethylaniline monooxygenase (N-oxide forming)
MYVHPLIQRGQLLWVYYDWWIKFIFMTIAGTTWGIDQWVGGVPQVRRHSDSLFIVKSDKLIPWLSEGRRKGIWNAIRTVFINVPIQKTNGTPVDLKPFPTHMTKDGVMHFPTIDKDPMVADTSRDTQVKPDVVILATGYRTKVDFLGDDYPDLADATRNRGIYRDIEDGIAYVGFVRPSIGKSHREPIQLSSRDAV